MITYLDHLIVLHAVYNYIIKQTIQRPSLSLELS